MIYRVPEPNTGMSGQLKKFDAAAYSQILNSRRYLFGLNGAAVIRWNQNEAQAAERIMRREWERRLGIQLVSTEVGVWMIQSLVQAAANEICGTWNAAPSGSAWDWAAWARFAQWTAGLSPERFMELLGDVNASACEKYAAYVVDGVLGATDPIIDTDPWYIEPYVWQLPAEGPYDFTSPPAGYPGTWTTPPSELPPTGELPPGTDNPLPPGDQPLPPLPQPDQPGGVGPIGYDYNTPPPPDKKPASVWQWLFAGALGLSGLLFVGATLWGMPDRRGNPVGGGDIRILRQTLDRAYSEMSTLHKLGEPKQAAVWAARSKAMDTDPRYFDPAFLRQSLRISSVRLSEIYHWMGDQRASDKWRAVYDGLSQRAA